MLKRRLQMLGFVLAFGLALLARASDRWETLEAIHCVENPRDTTRVGPHGELGAYQFRRSTWRMYTRTPFKQALDRQQSDKVAVMHYDWIRSNLARNGIEPSVHNIALAWNGGLGSVVNGRVPRASYGYAEQVSNIVELLHRQQVASVER